MRPLREMHDLSFSSSGDFMLDANDLDIKDTKRDNYQGAIQRIQTRIQSNKGDWRHSPQTGGDLSKFAGLPNKPEVGQEIELQMVNELVRGGLLSPRELIVQAFPISPSQVAVFVQVTPSGQRETIRLISSYSLSDNKVSVRN